MTEIELELALAQYNLGSAQGLRMLQKQAFSLRTILLLHQQTIDCIKQDRRVIAESEQITKLSRAMIMIEEALEAMSRTTSFHIEDALVGKGYFSKSNLAYRQEKGVPELTIHGLLDR